MSTSLYSQIELRSAVDGSDLEYGEEALREPMEVLSDIISILEPGLDGAQSKFVEFGNTLTSLHQSSDALISETKKSVKLFGETDNKSVFEGIRESAAVSMDTLRGGLENNRKLVSRIQDTIDVVKTLSKSIEAVEAVGSQLSIIGTNLAIQTSKLNDAGSATFSDFSHEIKSFSAYIRRMTSDIEQDTDEVIMVLSDVKDQMDSKLCLMASTILKAEKNSIEAISDIESLTSISSEMVRNRQYLSEEIAVHTRKSVMAIQVDDIARQRVEHVLEALKQIQTEGRLTTDPLLLKLQSSQLEEVSRDLERAFYVIQKSFFEIGESTKRIFSASGSKQTGFSSASAAIKRLQRAVLELKVIQEEGESLSKSMSDGLDRAILVSETISRHISDVSGITQELNLKAINALLMSRQWDGQGGNLVVLAKELHTLSKESIEFVSIVQNKIEHVSNSTTSLKSGAVFKNEIREKDNRFEEQLVSIDEVVQSIDGASSFAIQKAEQIRQTLEQTEPTLPFIMDFSSQLRCCAQKIDALLKQHTTEDEESSFSSKIDESVLLENYTMERERQLHKAILQSNLNESRGYENVPKNEDDELGNFELF